MGILAVDSIKSRTVAPVTVSDDLNVTGVSTVGVLTATCVVVGSAVTVNADGVITSGIVTATTFQGNFNGTTATFSGDVSIGGTLTYEDVERVDATGLSTFREGLNVGSPTGVGGTFNPQGDISAGIGSFSGAISGGAISGTTGTFTGAVSGTTGTFSAAVNIDDTTASTSTSTGALIVDGGVGIAKSLNVAGRVNVGGKVQFTVANPQLEFNNGGPRLWSPSANTLTFHSGGGFDATSDEKLRITSAGGFSFNNGELVERVKILATALNSNQVCSLDDGMIHYRTANLGGSGGTSLDLTSAVGLNTSMDTGDTIAFTLIHATNTTGNYVDHVNVDYIPVTENWVGGSAPSSGGSSGVDIYTFNIIKTGNLAWTTIANQVKTS